MRILITGASGFIGYWLSGVLASDYDVLGLTYSSKANLPFPHRAVDLRCERQIADTLRDFKPQVIVHAAAKSKVLECEMNPEDAQALNVEATGYLVRWAARMHSHVIFLSSDQVFSGKKGLYIESDRPDPINVYGRSKLQGERLVLDESSGNLVVRCNSVLGPTRGHGESFSDWVLHHLRENVQVTLFSDQYRSPVHIRVLAQILKHACIYPSGGVLHIGGHRRMSRSEVGFAVARGHGISADAIRVALLESHDRAGIMPRDTSYSIARLRQWIPQLLWRSLDEEFATDAADLGTRA